MQVHAHLTFNGNCREAMTFYQKCFRGKVRFQTVGESPGSAHLSKRMKACIVHATLSRNGFVLMGSDMVSDFGLIKGNAVALSVSCGSESEIRTVYRKLSVGGEKNHSLHTNSSGGLVGEVTDKFGNHWILVCDQPEEVRKEG